MDNNKPILIDANSVASKLQNGLEYDDTCPRNIKIRCADCACYWCDDDCNYCKLNPAHPDCPHYKNPFGGNEYDKSN